MRSQQTARGVLRSLLRHARKTDAHCPISIAATASAPLLGTGASLASAAPRPPLALGATADASPGTVAWSRYIIDSYRANMRLTRRDDVRAARAYATDILAYLQAVREQSALQGAYRGEDADAPSQQQSAARFVGLDMPIVPQPADLRKITGSVAEKYGAALAAVSLKAASSNSLTGVNALKAQLFGIGGLSETAAAATAGKVAAAAATPAETK